MSEQNPQEQQIQIKFGEDQISGHYSNNINISYTQEEFILDFFSLLPNSPMGKLIDRIILHPEHARRFSKVFAELITKYDNKELPGPQAAQSSTDNKIGFKTE